MDQLDQLVAQAGADFAAAVDSAALETAKARFLGKGGSITELLKGLGKLDAEARKAAGAEINKAKSAIEAALEARREALRQAALEAQLAAEALDVTLPGRGAGLGGLHPVVRTLERVEQLFRSIGFEVVDGPEIETDFYNFTALNTPANHPARSMHDTFYLENGEGVLLRTHTSPVQIRTMLAGKPPFRIIAPGRTYRRDSDATHTPMFHQIEGLVIDKGIHLGHLKWTLETFLKAFFERDDITLRLRPSYFPFTEPSVEVDVGYTIEKGQRVIGGSGDAPGGGWMEVLGSGMVHRKVIEACGLDPDEWQGFAFGMGIDRVAMLRYGIPNIRLMFENDPRFLAQF